MVKKGFFKKIISLTTLVLTILLCSFINVSAKNLTDVSLQGYPAYEVIPLKVDIKSLKGPAGPIGLLNGTFDFKTNFKDFNGNEPYLTSHSSYTTKCLWNFGDGNTSESDSPRHTYARPGRYTVKVSIKCSPLQTRPWEHLNTIFYSGEGTKIIEVR